MKHCLCTTTFGAIGQIFDPFYIFFKTKLILFYSSEQSWQSQKYFKRNFKISCRGGALKKDDCSGKGLRIWLENLRILNFATHVQHLHFFENKSEKYKRNTKHITKNTKWWN
jgi:hypothetical protein